VEGRRSARNAHEQDPVVPASAPGVEELSGDDAGETNQYEETAVGEGRTYSDTSRIQFAYIETRAGDTERGHPYTTRGDG
jgi:hypothetical protein